MKHIKSINEFYDDYNKSTNPLSNKELSDIVNKIYTQPNKNKPILDIPFDMTDNLYRDTKTVGSKISELYIFEQKLLKQLPFLKKFDQTERKETNDYFNVEYRFTKKVNDVALFTIELHIFGDFDSKFRVMFTPFIERREDTTSQHFKILKQETDELVSGWLEHLKEKGVSDEHAMKEMEKYFSDYKEGDIVSYEDSDFIKPLSVIEFNSTESNFFKDTIKLIFENFNIYDSYVYSIFNVDLNLI